MKLAAFRSLVACAASLLCWLPAPARPYKILGVFTFPSRSHYAPSDALMRRLAEKGHEVHVYSPYPRPSPLANHRDYDLSGCAICRPPVTPHIDNMVNLMSSPLMSVVFMSTMANVSAESVAECGPLRQLLESRQTFDLLVTETFLYDLTVMYAHKFRIPFICMWPNSLLPWHADRMGNPANPSYVPALLSGYLAPMDFWQRVHNTLIYGLSVVLYDAIGLPQNGRTMKTLLGPDSPSLHDFVRQTSIFFTYSHSSLNPVVPLVPAVVEIAGAHIAPAKALPPRIAKFIDESEHGVVYFCMGSVLPGESFPREKRDAFLKTFARLPQRVLWKWESDALPGQPDNVMIAKWMPQRDILAHPNVKLFISHGGLLGTSEAVYEGVPILGIPIFGDQRSNIQSIERNGAGELLEYAAISEHLVYEKVRRIVNEPRYREKAKLLSDRYRDRPMSPLDTAVYWAEYVVRHKGAPHLRSAAVDMPLYRYLLLDVVAFLLLAFVAALAAAYYACAFILTSFRRARGHRRARTPDEKIKSN